MRAKHLIRSCKKKSIETLAQSKLTLPVLLLVFLVLFSFLGACYLSFALLNLFLPIQRAGIYASAFSLFTAVFLLAPLWRGLEMLFLHDILFGRREASLLFYCYSHKRRYFFAVVRSMCALGGVALCILCMLLLTDLGQSVGKKLLDANRSAAALLILSLTVLFLFLILFCFFSCRNDSFLWDAVFLSAPLLSFRQSHILSARRMRSERRALRRLRCSFLPLWLLSFLLLGLPFIVVFPYYLGAKAHLAAALIKD